MAKPWLTSDDIVAAIKRKITLPDSQELLTDDQILSFVNEEMLISMVPSILSYHEEFFVTSLLEGGATKTALVGNQNKYEIPTRAIGSRIRDLFYEDSSGNRAEMVRINPDEQVFFSSNYSVTSNVIKKYYFEGNNIVLVPQVNAGVTGYLVFTYFLRPNQLVTNNRAAIISGFKKDITIDNASLVDGDQLIINNTVLTAVASSPGANEFLIDGSSTASALNLQTLINTLGLGTATNTNEVVSVTFTTSNNTLITSNANAFIISNNLTFVCEDNIPDNFVNNTLDILQTKPGHQIKAISLPYISINNNELTMLNSLVPTTLIVGDYLCEEYECIIPQIPTDLHIDLVEKASARILAAIGDQIGLQTVEQKIRENQDSKGMLIDNRAEGSPQKVLNRNSFLRWNKNSIYRRY